MTVFLHFHASDIFLIAISKKVTKGKCIAELRRKWCGLHFMIVVPQFNINVDFYGHSHTGLPKTNCILIWTHEGQCLIYHINDIFSTEESWNFSHFEQPRFDETGTN